MFSDSEKENTQMLDRSIYPNLLTAVLYREIEVTYKVEVLQNLG